MPRLEHDEAARAARPAGADLPGDERGRGRPPWWRVELLAALEIAGLAALAFTRPVLDSFGRAPETFIARDASRSDVVLFALAVALVPTLVAALVGAAARLGGGWVRRVVHLTLLGALGAVAAWRFVRDTVGWGRWPVVALGLVAGVLVVVVRRRIRSVGTYLRFLGAASVFFLVQFLVLSPASSLAVGRGGGTADEAATAAVEAATGDEPPPIVMVVVDAVATSGLLDGDGAIDGELYPHLAAFADDATWYRNNTTVSAWTYQAVPALLSGRFPGGGVPLPDTRTFPDNLFTLFAGTHDVEAVEQITRLCPASECASPSGSAVPTMLGDAVDWWRGGLDTSRDGAEILPGAIEPDRGDDFVEWIDAQDFTLSDGRPGLWFYHLVMPHEPWVLLDDGSHYEGVGDDPYGLWLSMWGDVGTDVGLQRHTLQTQATDRMLGQLFDQLRGAGTYDDALIVVAGDHGQAFAPGNPLRGLTEAQYEQIAWTPLLIKAPGQTDGVVDDSNVWSIDLLPTVAEMLGVDLPWEVDGLPAGDAGRGRDPGDKRVIDSELHTMEAVEGEGYVAIDGRAGFDRVVAADPVPGSGELAVWQRGEHGGLVGRDVADLDVGDGEGGTLAVEQLDRLQQPGNGPPRLELVGEVSAASGVEVAIAVNGVVAAVAPVGSPGFGLSVVHALLLPDPFGADNEIAAYTITGPAGAVRLHPLTVTPA